jgi:predicted transcriptional regulator of viral defense system
MESTADKSAINRLYRLAEPQAGYFTAAQAVEAGVSRRLLSHHSADRGALIRVDRGLYRLRNFPGSPREDLVATWLAVGRPIDAVVSHDSALDLYGLSDVIPEAVHLTAARAHRGHRSKRPGVRLHFVTDGVPLADRAGRDELPVTSVERTLLDSLAVHGVTEQTELAVAQALDRGLTSVRRLKVRADDGSKAGQERLSKALGGRV